jgi:hypothetical protein
VDRAYLITSVQGMPFHSGFEAQAHWLDVIFQVIFSVIPLIYWHERRHFFLHTGAPVWDRQEDFQGDGMLEEEEECARIRLTRCLGASKRAS